MFEKILIANRGEIALRVIRACKEMGIRTLAVYSQADVDSLHVQMADEAVCIGPPKSSESYLKIDRLISAAELGDVEAIHPGYGFLAENPHFAEVCESCNIKFIGPTSANIRTMGDKVAARNAAKKAGVSIVPGSDGPVANEEEAKKWARQIGYPVILKSQMGGGGRGLRVAHNEVSLIKGFHSSKSEGEAAFGDGSIYLEKCIENPHHIEVQIISDERHKIVHLGERDCSIQRRHQKLIEESPSPLLAMKEFRDLRKKIGKAAIRVAEAIKYINAGTIEFIVDNDGHFYFMEMNTRVQVEHPVTEQITGVDIVKEQIRIAAGEPLSVNQGDIDDTFSEKYAIECRINAEDPFNGFTPSPGKIDLYYSPGGLGVRVDSHCYGGYVIPQYYDSLIAKVIATGPDRKTALDRMSCALDEFIIRGVKTTVPFLKVILKDLNFRRGRYSTSFVDGLLSTMHGPLSPLK